jgi:hypothetical protein
MFKFGLTAGTMVDVKVELGGNGRAIQMSRTVSLGYLGNTVQQIGNRYRVYSGIVDFDSLSEKAFLISLFAEREFYLFDGTTGGTPSPILVYLNKDYVANYDEPTTNSGSYQFLLEEVASA